MQSLSRQPVPLVELLKNKSSSVKCLSGTGLRHAIRSENLKIQVLPTLPTNLTSPLSAGVLCLVVMICQFACDHLCP